jgi:hypothetical protein
MSTRGSVWGGDDPETGKSIHIYFELADREVNPLRAPVYIGVTDIESKDAEAEEIIKLPSDVARALVKAIKPGYEVDVL